MFQWTTQWSPFESQSAEHWQLIKIKSIVVIIIIIIIIITIIIIIIIIISPMSITPISTKEKTNKNIQISFYKSPRNK